jgi:hypothetical protein
MVSGNKTPEPAKVLWSIDTQWFEKNNRSFLDLAQRGLCPKCVEKLGKKKKKATSSEVLSAIQDCCSKLPDFMTVRMPIMESVFRILLANGNKPMAVEDIGHELSIRRGGDNYAGSPQMLTRLLNNDHWYGFKKVSEG